MNFLLRRLHIFDADVRLSFLRNDGVI